MIPLFAAILGAVAAAMLVAVADVRRHDQQVRERDDDLEEWIIARHRERRRRLNELAEKRRVAGVLSDGAAAQALGKVNTIVLYEYREEKRQAEAFRLRVDASEGWQHRLVRWVRRAGLPHLTTPARASALIEHWNEGTDGNALTWSLADILAELPRREQVPAAAATRD